MFYQGVSYEALGIIAHKYSNNKIPLLEQARDALLAAAEELRPFVRTMRGNCRSRRLTLSDSPTFDALPHNSGLESLSSLCVSSSVIEIESRPPKDPVTTTTEDDSRFLASNIYYTPKFNTFDPCLSPGNFLARRKPDENVSINCAPINCDGVSQKARLSQSLSSGHILVNDLVPSPLFSRASVNKIEAQRSIQVSKHRELDEKPLPLTPINRPLPELPFKHQLNFELRGNRIFQVPKRTLALQTLVSRYERTVGLHENQDAISPFTAKTPVTERFKMISACFERKKCHQADTLTDLEAAILAVHTPCPAPTKRPQPLPPPPTNPYQHYTPIRSITPQNPTHEVSTANYDIALNEFQNSLTNKLIPNITTAINNARQIQLDHETERRNRFQRLANRPAAGPSGQVEESVRLASFWSFKAAVAHADAEQGEAAQKKRELKQRIARLKESEWKSVRAEAKGFKGVEYYAALRAKVEVEIAKSSPARICGYDNGCSTCGCEHKLTIDGPGPAVLEGHK